MKKIQILFFTLLVCLFAVDLYAQEQGKISGKVLSTLNIQERSISNRMQEFAESQYFSLGCRILYSASSSG